VIGTSKADVVLPYGFTRMRRTHLGVLQKAAIIGEGHSTVDGTSRDSAAIGARSGTPSAKVRGRAVSGDASGDLRAVGDGVYRGRHPACGGWTP
jgi:hypothetical protein